MVDFSKHLTKKKVEAPVDPVKLYDTLDRASDKGPLRPAQLAMLKDWFIKRRNIRDVIVKLNTGQGKTLIGLLMLQSCLNEKTGSVIYLCPNNYLVEQTREQAKQFGIATCEADPELPDDFTDGKSILITSVHKLFNGLTKFGIGRQFKEVNTILMDDAHACSDTIREKCSIRLPKDDPAYSEIFTLFADSLEQQGAGTYADITQNQHDALLPVPYWAWMDKESEIANILSRGSNRLTIKFVWPLIKDNLKHCQCVVSGSAIEIEPYIPPLALFGTYWKASRRIFMSATVTDDAFLIKGLQLQPETITQPLTYDKESWSGEKMILIPSLIHETLDRETIVQQFATPETGRKYGVVALVPSFKKIGDWQSYGAVIARKDALGNVVDELKSGKFKESLVLVNRYDGIDLPDDSCRILILDGKPYSESLIDLYQESCRANSQSTIMRTVRTIEQGLGRSVRGEKDYSVIIVTGTDITRFIREKSSREYLSDQMNAQIQIGLEIAGLAGREIEVGETPMRTLKNLIRQCLERDSGWKQFYIQKMNVVKPSGSKSRVLELYSKELVAEQKYQAGDYEGARKTVQAFLDENLVDQDEKAWYLQEMARYLYSMNRVTSQDLQVKAHKANRLLLRPPHGVTITKLTIVSEGRMERIKDWVKRYENYQQLDIALSDILAHLVFGAKADKFEQALNDLSFALGFKGERPDKVWKEGPDNLWALDDTTYILWECKNEVELKRAEITKYETNQINSSFAWFEKNYSGKRVKNILIHPTHTVGTAAAFNCDVGIMRDTELKNLVKAIRGFFKSFETIDFNDLSLNEIHKLIEQHKLSVNALLENYTKVPRNSRSTTH
jgi:replicative superfamily II helicase